MQRSTDDLAGLFSIGVTFRTAPLALRERLEVPPDGEAAFVAGLQAQGLKEALLLSTCDRVEIFGLAEATESGSDLALAALARHAGTAPAALQSHLVHRQGDAAVQRLFAIAASLESQTVGEPQVLGQVKDAERRAAAAGALGPTLRAALAAAYAAAKRVRSETRLGERPVSLAAVALKNARTLFGELADLHLLLLGLGDIGELLAWEFRDKGLRRIVVAHERPLRAAAAAQRFQGHHAALTDLPQLLPAADIVIAAVGAGRPLLDRALLRPALKARRGRPMLLLDTALPRDLAGDVETLDAAFVFALDDLERLAAAGKDERSGEVESAWAIVAEELAAFRRDRAGRDVAPEIALLHREVERLRQEVLADRPASAEAATQLLLKRLLHRPALALRQAAVEGDGASLAAALRRLFQLPGKPGDGA